MLLICDGLIPSCFQTPEPCDGLQQPDGYPNQPHKARYLVRSIEQIRMSYDRFRFDFPHPSSEVRHVPSHYIVVLLLRHDGQWSTGLTAANP